MPSSPQELTPWLIVVGIVAASLWWKGYFARYTTPPRPYAATGPAPTLVGPPQPPAGYAPSVSIDNLPASTLGLAFAKASKREGEEELMRQMAAHFHATNQAIFAAPFVVPAPPAPPAAGSNP